MSNLIFSPDVQSLLRDRILKENTNYLYRISSFDCIYRDRINEVFTEELKGILSSKDISIDNWFSIFNHVVARFLGRRGFELYDNRVMENFNRKLIYSGIVEGYDNEDLDIDSLANLLDRIVALGGIDTVFINTLNKLHNSLAVDLIPIEESNIKYNTKPILFSIDHLFLTLTIVY